MRRELWIAGGAFALVFLWSRSGTSRPLRLAESSTSGRRETIADDATSLTDPVRFASGSAQVPSTFMPRLERVARWIQADNITVSLRGHTDNVGSIQLNHQVGLQRANAVADVLMSYGVPRGQLLVESGGETKPSVSNGTASGRAQNRRVEIVPREQNFDFTGAAPF